MLHKAETSDFGIEYLKPGNKLPDAVRMLAYDSAANVGKRGGVKGRVPLPDFQFFEEQQELANKVPFDIMNRAGSWWLHPDVMSMLHMKNATPKSTAHSVIGLKDVAPVTLGSQWRNYAQSSKTEPMIETFLEHNKNIPLDQLVQLDLPLDMNRNKLDHALIEMANRRLDNPNVISDPTIHSIIDKYTKGKENNVPESVEDIIQRLSQYDLPLSGADNEEDMKYDLESPIPSPDIDDDVVREIVPKRWMHDNTPYDLQQIIEPYDINSAIPFPQTGNNIMSDKEYGDYDLHRLIYDQPLQPRIMRKEDDYSGFAAKINEKRENPSSNVFVHPNIDPAQLPCKACGNRILNAPCRACGRPASLGANVLTGEPMDLAFRMLKGEVLIVSESVAKKLCPEGKAAAKRKFDVYPSAYANGWAVQYCRGKFKKKGKKKK